MFCHGLSWFVMVRHGSSWLTSWFLMFLCHGFVMVRHGSLSWFTVMVHCHGLSWFIIVHHGSLSWFVMVRHGSLSWFVMVHCHGLSWFVMVHCHGSSWFVMVHHGLSWFTVMVSTWFVMVRDVLFSKILQKRSCDPQFSQSESQIYYQISFLMRLLIFPFPFKEHTSKELCLKWTC